MFTSAQDSQGCLNRFRVDSQKRYENDVKTCVASQKRYENDVKTIVWAVKNDMKTIVWTAKNDMKTI